MNEIVPGLKRGIAVLTLLGQGNNLTLEQITTSTGFPKASVLRMLTTLQQLTLVEKLSDGKSYRALALITPIRDFDNSFEMLLEKILQKGSSESGFTTEWYLPQKEGLVLTKRKTPDNSEIRINAEVGFVRKWQSELDAVAMIGTSFSPLAPKEKINAPFWQYDIKGKKTKLSPTEIKKQLEKIKPPDVTTDVNFNTRGIMRMATGVYRKKKLVGVLAFAMPFTPNYKNELSPRRELLKKIAKRLSDEP